MTVHAQAGDRRNIERLTVKLSAVIYARGREYAATIVNISLDGAAFESAVRPAIDDIVVVYLDQVERIQAKVVRKIMGGFAVHFIMSDQKYERLASVLRRAITGEPIVAVALLQHVGRNGGDDFAFCRHADGTIERCAVTDVSVIGASIHSRRKPLIGELVRLGCSEAIVVRHTRDGFSVEFPNYRKTVPLWQSLKTPA